MEESGSLVLAQLLARADERVHVSVAPLKEDIGSALPQKDLQDLVDVLVPSQGEVSGQRLLVSANVEDFTYELFPAVQVGGSENVVSLQWLQQKVVPNPGYAVGGIWGLGRAGRSEVGTEALCSP